MKTENNLIALIFCLFLISSCETTNRENKKITQPVSKEMSTNKYQVTTYKLDGFNLTCCKNIIDYSLNEVPGFIKSVADIKNMELTVWYSNDKGTEQEIQKAIDKTPYKIVVKN